MNEIYLKETSQDDADYRAKELYPVDRDVIYSLEPINRPKVIDLSELVGNDQILFEFSDNKNYWNEGYLMSVSDQGGFYMGHKCNGKFPGGSRYNYIRFQTDRWYFHNGKSGCPYPEGVEYEITCTVILYSGRYRLEQIKSKMTKGCWNHEDKYKAIMAHRPTGLLPGYVMPGGDENDK